MSITSEEFVKAWQASSNIDEVVKKTKMTKFAASSRAGRYRKLGIALKTMSRGSRERIDVAALKRIVEATSKSNGQAKVVKQA